MPSIPSTDPKAKPKTEREEELVKRNMERFVWQQGDVKVIKRGGKPVKPSSK